MKYSRDSLHMMLRGAPLTVICASHEEAIRLRWRLYKLRGDLEVELKVEAKTLRIEPRKELAP